MTTRRTAVSVVYAASPEKAAGRVVDVVREVQATGSRDAYYAVDELKPPRDLEVRPGDQTKLWALTERLIAPYLAAPADAAPQAGDPRAAPEAAPN